MMVYVDGGCRGNQQVDVTKRRMIAVVTDDHGIVLVRKSGFGGSNNIAELWAVVEAVEWAAARGLGLIDVRTDSRNNLSWVNPLVKLGRRLNDRAHVERMRERIFAAPVTARLVWIPRAKNLAGHVIEAQYGV